MADLKITANNSDEIMRKVHERMTAALEAIGNQAVSYAKSNITAAGRVDTGAMRNSISHIVQNDVCHVGTNVEYAIYNEYGTGIYAADGNGRKKPWAYEGADGAVHWTRGMRPIHFLKNAVQNNKDTLIAIIKKYLNGNG